MKIFLCGVIDLVCRFFDESVYVDVKNDFIPNFTKYKIVDAKVWFFEMQYKKKTSYVVKMKINIII